MDDKHTFKRSRLSSTTEGGRPLTLGEDGEILDPFDDVSVNSRHLHVKSSGFGIISVHYVARKATRISQQNYLYKGV